jgi:hypothetical protein
MLRPRLVLHLQSLMPLLEIPTPSLEIPTPPL